MAGDTTLLPGPPIKVICTDKRQHKPRRLGRRPGEYEGGRLAAACTSCGRDYQIGTERFSDLVARCQAAGLTEVDISALPKGRGG